MDVPLETGSAIFGGRDGVAAAIERLRTALSHVEDEAQLAGRSAR